MNCITCGNEFERRGQNHKRCDICAPLVKKARTKAWINKHVVTGAGSGSNTGSGSNNHMYKHGICTMRRYAKERLIQLDYCCERCGNKIDVSVRGMWAGHHKDHNRQNNVPENIEVLCKRCHQVEHECWRAFQGVTTIPKGSTQETVEAHGTQTE